jgi:hypothetical protein
MASSLERSDPSAFVLKYSRKSSLLSATVCKCLAHASIVADDTITRSSGRFFMIFLSRPSRRSVYAPRSCASSICAS